MPLKYREVEAFLRNGPGDCRVVLVYGPNEGLVHERVDIIARHVVEDMADPFRVVDLTGKDLADNPGRLANEVAAISMLGGRRLIRLRDVTDTIAPLVEYVASEVPEDAPGQAYAAGKVPDDALTIITAGELPPRSTLRKLGDSLPRMAAIPCYADENKDLRRLIEETLSKHRIKAAPDAVAWLVGHLGADRGMTRNELEKLVLFAGNDSTLDLDSAMACIGDSAGLNLDDLVFAAGGGNLAAVDRDYTRALRNGIAASKILRATSRHFMRLRQVRRSIESGESLDAIVKDLRPPVFFKYKDPFNRQARSWLLADIDRVISLLWETERQSRFDSAINDALCGRALLQIAQLGRRSAGSRASRGR